MSDAEMKPCPFCGGKAELIDLGDAGYRVACVSGHGWCQCEQIRATESGVIKSWNTRTLPADQVMVPVELIEAIAMIGVDFGYGNYVLEDKFIDQARDILQASKKGEE
jgi:hypothetical protein